MPKIKYGQTPLHDVHLHIDVARLLLEYGADVNARDNDGNTPLVLACFGDFVGRTSAY